jgi:transposase
VTATAHGIQLAVVRLPEAKRGFVLLLGRWMVERSFAWLARFRRLARDYQRLPAVLVGLHFIAFACLLLHRIIPLMLSS